MQDDLLTVVSVEMVYSATVNLAVPHPFPRVEIFSYLAHRATPGVETFENTIYVRQVSGGSFRVRIDSETVTVEGLGREVNVDETARLTRLFQIQRRWEAPKELKDDPVLAPLIARVPGFRPLGCWEPFELCLRTIVGQQVSVAAAGTLMRRLGDRAPSWTPETVASANLENMGMPGKRVQTLRTLAENSAAGDIPWTAPWPDLREALARLPGFGPWTLDYLGIRLGRDLDSFPAADLGLMRGVGVRSAKELLARAEPWRPYRGWAASYLWMM